MASFETLKNGHIRVSIFVNGIRESKTLATASKAKNWAKDREAELSQWEGLDDRTRTMGELFARYANEISPNKRGGHWEQIRLNMLINSYPTLSELKLVKAKREDIEDWIKLRLEKVKPSSVNRELNLLSHALAWARRWRWISHNPMKDLERPKNPMKDLERPKNPPARFRRITENEIKEMCLVLGYRDGAVIEKKREMVGAAFVFAIETAMRAGEICQLRLDNIDFQAKVAHLSKTKNGDQRDVPLSDRAIAILKNLPTPSNECSPLFQLTSAALSSLFRKYRLKTRIHDLTFHDTRHEATTRLADKLHVLELAAVTGHRNINELLTYYNKSASELATKINNPTNPKADDSNLDYSNLAQKLLQELSKVGGLDIKPKKRS